MRKFEGVTGDGDIQTSHMTDEEYKRFAYERYNCIDEKSGQITQVTVGGTKHDNGKPRMDLLPFEAIEEVAKVLGLGAEKYSPWNWYKGFDYGRLLGASLRHISAFQQGQDKDPETGQSHLAHAACNLLFLITLQLRNRGKDDRCVRDTKQGT
jgi:hypothetical protein